MRITLEKDLRKSIIDHRVEIENINRQHKKINNLHAVLHNIENYGFITTTDLKYFLAYGFIKITTDFNNNKKKSVEEPRKEVIKEEDPDDKVKEFIDNIFNKNVKYKIEDLHKLTEDYTSYNRATNTYHIRKPVSYEMTIYEVKMEHFEFYEFKTFQLPGTIGIKLPVYSGVDLDDIESKYINFTAVMSILETFYISATRVRRWMHENLDMIKPVQYKKGKFILLNNKALWFLLLLVEACNISFNQDRFSKLHYPFDNKHSFIDTTGMFTSSNSYNELSDIARMNLEVNEGLIKKLNEEIVNKFMDV